MVFRSVWWEGEFSYSLRWLEAAELPLWLWIAVWLCARCAHSLCSVACTKLCVASDFAFVGWCVVAKGALCWI